MTRSAWDAWDASDGGRRVPPPVLDRGTDAVHSALVPPGALHHRVTAALANWQLDDAEELLADVEREPSPYVAADPAADVPEDAPVSLCKAWADTLRAHLSSDRINRKEERRPLELQVALVWQLNFQLRNFWHRELRELQGQLLDGLKLPRCS